VPFCWPGDGCLVVWHRLSARASLLLFMSNVEVQSSSGPLI
jgi:hypothetical protein